MVGKLKYVSDNFWEVLVETEEGIKVYPLKEEYTHRLESYHHNCLFDVQIINNKYAIMID